VTLLNHNGFAPAPGEEPVALQWEGGKFIGMAESRGKEKLFCPSPLLDHLCPLGSNY